MNAQPQGLLLDSTEVGHTGSGHVGDQTQMQRLWMVYVGVLCQLSLELGKESVEQITTTPGYKAFSGSSM